MRATDTACRPLSPQQNPREKPHVATEESQERCPKKASRQTSWPSDLRHRLQARAVRYQHGRDLSCDRRPSACESAPCRWRGKMQAEKQLAIARRRVEVEAEAPQTPGGGHRLWDGLELGLNRRYGGWFGLTRGFS